MALLRARIDLDAIAHNVAELKKAAAGAAVMCVVKADAYGHGIERVIKVMETAGADIFGVATLDEARYLRQLGTNLPIQAWLWEASEDFVTALADDIQLVAPSLDHVRALVKSEVPAAISLKVETGMHRSGIDRADWGEAFDLAAKAEHIEVRGLMSHLACADEPDNPANQQQIEQFRQAIEMARRHGLAVEHNQMANSAATMYLPSAHFQIVRPGLACYGLDPAPSVASDIDLRPAMTWASSIITVKSVQAGDRSSYGLTWAAPQDGYVAIVACGYADGLPRNVQGHLEVGIAGKRYPQVGRVCMDQIVVDLGENPFGVQAGDEAILFGNHGMSATELAQAVGTINYEIVVRPTGRTVREYEGGIQL